MAPLIEYDQFSILRDDGVLVCYMHRLEDCDDCGFDNMTFSAFDIPEEIDEEEVNATLPYLEDPDEINQSPSDTLSPEQVKVLWGEEARFDPDTDVQLANKSTMTASKPRPLATFSRYKCDSCKLIWMVGKGTLEATQQHPSHHNFWERFEGSRRTLLVQTSATVYQAETSRSRAGLGILFHDDSPHNISMLLDESSPQEQHFADLQVIRLALSKILDQVHSERRRHVSIHGKDNTKRARLNAVQMRALIVTDSSFFVNGFCALRPSWAWDAVNCSLTALRGETIKHSMMWSGIEDLVRLSAKEGIQIQFWCVPEGENHKANQLAWKPLEALVVEDPMEF